MTGSLFRVSRFDRTKMLLVPDRSTPRSATRGDGDGAVWPGTNPRSLSQVVPSPMETEAPMASVASEALFVASSYAMV